MYGIVPYVRKTTVYLSEALKLRLERTARDQQVSEADVIRAAVDAYTASARPRPVLPLFGSIGGSDLADRADEILAAEFGRD